MSSPHPYLEVAALDCATEDLFPKNTWRILVVDDDARDTSLIENLIRASRLEDTDIDVQPSLLDGIEALSSTCYSACIVDDRIGADTGLDFVDQAKHVAPHTPIVMLSSQDSHDLDVAAMNAGVSNYLAKRDLTPTGIERCLRYAVRHARQRVALERMARRDPITGLHNRVSIEERLAHAAARARRIGRTMAVVLIDLDGFKSVNDTLGHDAGDHLLLVVAQRLRQMLRGYDTVGRLGGDEFVAVVEDLAGPFEATEIAQRIVDAIQPPFGLAGEVGPIGMKMRVGASVGYVCHPGAGLSDRDLLKAADQAMYRAKKAGKGRAEAYRADRQAAPNKRSNLVSSQCVLAAAAADQLRLALQPQVHLQTKRISSIEALVRWRPHRQAERMPADFVPALERTGGIEELDLWVFGRALAIREQIAPSLQISVNVSPVVLENPTFVRRLARLIPDPANIELELTESAGQLDRPDVRMGIRTLKDLGCRWAVDDFGTGHSTLARLQDLPIDTVKIDKKFIHRIDDTARSRAIVGSMVDLAHRLDLRVVAEGVETEAQEAQLRALGVDFGQGYRFAPPLPQDELEPWLRQEREVAP